MITMRKRTATLFFWGLVLACGSVAAQQGPGLIAKNPIRLYDAGKGRIYVLGEGFIDVRRQMDPDHYDRIGRVATPADSRTGLFVPDLGELFETTPHHGAQGAQIGVYGIQ